MIGKKDIHWWLEEFFVKHNITFKNQNDKGNFKKYYIYHTFRKVGDEFPILDQEYRPEFRRFRDFINSKIIVKLIGPLTKIDLIKLI